MPDVVDDEFSEPEACIVNYSEDSSELLSEVPTKMTSIQNDNSVIGRMESDNTFSVVTFDSKKNATVRTEYLKRSQYVYHSNNTATRFSFDRDGLVVGEEKVQVNEYTVALENAPQPHGECSNRSLDAHYRFEGNDRESMVVCKTMLDKHTHACTTERYRKKKLIGGTVNGLPISSASSPFCSSSLVSYLKISLQMIAVAFAAAATTVLFSSRMIPSSSQYLAVGMTIALLLITLVTYRRNTRDLACL